MRIPRNYIVIVMLLVSFMVLWGVTQMVGTAQRRVTEDEEEGAVGGDKQRLDAIFVLMGGQTKDAGVPLHVERRLDRAVELQKERRTREGGLPPIVSVSAMTTSKPPHLTPENFIWFESNSASEYLHNKYHVPFELLLKECTSYDTRGNGYFSLVQFAIPAGWRHIAVITSEFHMLRSKAIFEWMYGLPGAGAGLHHFPAAESQLPQSSKSQGFALEYHSVSDDGLDVVALQNRKKVETEELPKIKELSKRVKTLPELHDYIYLQNELYNTADIDDFGKDALDVNRPEALY